MPDIGGFGRGLLKGALSATEKAAEKVKDAAEAASRKMTDDADPDATQVVRSDSGAAEDDAERTQVVKPDPATIDDDPERTQVLRGRQRPPAPQADFPANSGQLTGQTPAPPPGAMPSASGRPAGPMPPAPMPRPPASAARPGHMAPAPAAPPMAPAQPAAAARPMEPAPPAQIAQPAEAAAAVSASWPGEPASGSGASLAEPVAPGSARPAGSMPPASIARPSAPPASAPPASASWPGQPAPPASTAPLAEPAPAAQPVAGAPAVPVAGASADSEPGQVDEAGEHADASEVRELVEMFQQLLAKRRPPAGPVPDEWSLGIGDLLAEHPKVPKRVRGLITKLNRFGGVAISPGVVAFDGDDVPWEKVTEVRTRHVVDYLVGDAVQQQVENLPVPWFPGRGRLVDALGQALLTVTIATVKDQLDQIDVDFRVPAEIVYKGAFGRSKELGAGVVSALVLTDPAVGASLVATAQAHGITVTAGEDEMYANAEERAAQIREKVAALEAELDRFTKRFGRKKDS